ncbi:Hypothetical predicted protein [Mytilus galloprovincialis]|uniref:Peptidase S1 domain-containing protein n=1 Tax=Mytilus galloprovincialis TaxID=29158 RepID=A0A8B6FQT4_MYTGA|nr:Hypothetical predicted protein [Mytilus galloprovincialis]
MPSCAGSNSHQIQVSTAASVKIVKGDDADIEDHPWMVSFQIRRGGVNYTHSCGGAIIDKSWVLTAAHCNLFNYEAKDMRIAAGSSFLSQIIEFIAVKKFHVHKDFDTGKNFLQNDLMLLELQKPLKFGSTINKIDLDTNVGHNYTGEVCTITGWGDTDVNLGLFNFSLVVVTETMPRKGRKHYDSKRKEKRDKLREQRLKQASELNLICRNNQSVTSLNCPKQDQSVNSINCPIQSDQSVNSINCPIQSDQSVNSINCPIEPDQSVNSINCPINIDQSVSSINCPIEPDQSVNSINCPINNDQSVSSINCPIEPDQSVNSINCPINIDQSVNSINCPIEPDQSVNSINCPIELDQSVNSINYPIEPDQSINSINCPIQSDQSVNSINCPIQSDQSVNSINCPIQSDQSVNSINYVNCPIKQDQSVNSINYVNCPIQSDQSVNSINYVNCPINKIRASTL